MNTGKITQTAFATLSRVAESNVPHRFAGQFVADILKRKKGSIKQTPLPPGSPGWEEFTQMIWEQIEQGAQANRPGFKVVRKLLTDRRFDR
jgi:hypothetical protein